MLTGTANFSVAEVLHASGGFIPPDYEDNAQAVIEWLQALRDYIGRPILITNLYRTAAHNAEIPGSATNSQHLQALGADFDVIGMTNHDALAHALAGIASGALPAVHQLITYTTDHHVHVGLGLGDWPADNQALIHTAAGTVALTDDALAALTNKPVTTLVQSAAQIADAAAIHPLVAFVVVAGLWSIGGRLAL